MRVSAPKVGRRFLVTVAVVLTAATVAPLVSTQPALAATIGNPTNATKRTGNEDESAIAVNPNNNQQVAVMTNGIAGDAGLPLSLSSDGGQTWTRTVFATGTGAGGDGRPVACCDPTLSWDNFGNLFVGYLQRTPRTIELYVTSDMGANFTNLGPVDTGAPGSLDQPTVTSGAGAVWVTWKDDTGGIAARGRSVTGALTFGAWLAEESASTTGNFGDVAIGPSGQVMVTYETPTGNEGPASINTQIDADGLGVGGFAAAVTVATTNVGGFDYLPAQQLRSVDAEPGLAWYRGGVAPGRLSLVYNDESPNESNDFNVLVITSLDGGVTWSAPVQVHPATPTRSQMLPKIAVDQSSGVIGVSFYDASADAGDGPNATDLDGVANNDVTESATWSTDGGATWAGVVAVADAPTNGYAMNGLQQLGDFTGLAFAGGIMYPSWADSSNSTGDNPDGTRVSLDVYTAAVQPLITQTDLSLTKACPGGPVPPGGTIACTLTVKNLGTNDAQTVVVTDNLPAGLTVAATPAPGGGGFTCVINGGGSQLSCSKPTQPAGVTSVITYTVKVSDTAGPGATFTNSASVTSTTTDPNSANNSSSANITTPACTINSPAAGGQTVGTAGDDVICGSANNDDIAGVGGNDIIYGFGGADRLSGGDGNDTLIGGAGNDQLAGGYGNDKLFGEADTDSASGGVGTDQCVAEAVASCES